MLPTNGNPKRQKISPAILLRKPTTFIGEDPHTGGRSDLKHSRDYALNHHPNTAIAAVGEVDFARSIASQAEGAESWA